MRFLLMFMLAAFALAGCRDESGGQNAMVAGLGDVHVDSFRIVDSGDASAADFGTKAVYLVVKLTFTNDIRENFSPVISHFVFQDRDGSRFPGLETGSAALIGISNPRDPLKKDAKVQYTVGFRIPPGANGSVLYENFDSN